MKFGERNIDSTQVPKRWKSPIIHHGRNKGVKNNTLWRRFPKIWDPNVWSTWWMNIPQTLGPNENYIILLSLSLSPQRSQRDTLNFCACFQSCLYMQARVLWYVWEKHALRRRRRICGSSSCLRVGKKKTNQKPRWLVPRCKELN